MGHQAASGTGATQLLAPRGGAFSLWRGTVSEPDTPQGARAGGHGQTRGPRALPAVCCSLGGCEGQGSTKGRKRLHKGRFRLGGEAGAAGSSGGRRGGGRGGSPGHGVSPAWMPPTQTAGSGGKQGTSHRKPRTPRENKQNRNGIQHAARLHVNSAGAAPNPRRLFPHRTLL